MNLHAQEMTPTRSLKVRLEEGGSITIRYKPHVYTPEFLDRMESQNLNILLQKVLDGWDLTVYQNWLDWLKVGVERRWQILELQRKAQKLPEGDQERAAILLELARLGKAEDDDQDPPAPDPKSGEVPFPLDDWRLLTGLSKRWRYAIAKAIADDQSPNPMREDDSEESFGAS